VETATGGTMRVSANRPEGHRPQRAFFWVGLALVLLLGGCFRDANERAGRLAKVQSPTTRSLPDLTLGEGGGHLVGPPRDTEPDSLDRYEQARRELEQGVIAYNPPERMRLEDTVRIEVRVTRHTSPDFTSDLQGPGEIRTEELPVGTTMRTELKSIDFDVTSLRPDDQKLWKDGFRSWLWDIKI
jgi:hypothetical protein